MECICNYKLILSINIHLCISQNEINILQKHCVCDILSNVRLWFIHSINHKQSVFNRLWVAVACHSFNLYPANSYILLLGLILITRKINSKKNMDKNNLEKDMSRHGKKSALMKKKSKRVENHKMHKLITENLEIDSKVKSK